MTSSKSSAGKIKFTQLAESEMKNMLLGGSKWWGCEKRVADCVRCEQRYPAESIARRNKGVSHFCIQKLSCIMFRENVSHSTNNSSSSSSIIRTRSKSNNKKLKYKTSIIRFYIRIFTSGNQMKNVNISSIQLKCGTDSKPFATFDNNQIWQQINSVTYRISNQ